MLSALSKAIVEGHSVVVAEKELPPDPQIHIDHFQKLRWRRLNIFVSLNFLSCPFGLVSSTCIDAQLQLDLMSGQMSAKTQWLQGYFGQERIQRFDFVHLLACCICEHKSCLKSHYHELRCLAWRWFPIVPFRCRIFESVCGRIF